MMIANLPDRMHVWRRYMANPCFLINRHEQLIVNDCQDEFSVYALVSTSTRYVILIENIQKQSHTNIHAEITTNPNKNQIIVEFADVKCKLWCIDTSISRYGTHLVFIPLR